LTSPAGLVKGRDSLEGLLLFENEENGQGGKQRQHGGGILAPLFLV
jgi:hypothetical protein